MIQNENEAASPILTTPHSATNKFYSVFFNSDANYAQTELENTLQVLVLKDIFLFVVSYPKKEVII